MYRVGFLGVLLYYIGWGFLGVLLCKGWGFQGVLYCVQLGVLHYVK